MRYTYKRGEWLNDCPLLDCEDDEDFYDYLKRIKFNISPMNFGGEDDSHIQIYESEEKPIFFADVSLNAGKNFTVYLPDFPSMMMFIRDHAAAFSAESVNSYQKEIFELMRKFFQATHGHDSFHICEQCDPLEWKRRLAKSNKK